MVSMIRIGALTLAIGIAASSAGSAAMAPEVNPEVKPEGTAITSTGWVSDIGCAAPRVKKGLIGPSNTECVKKCFDEGKTPVFVSEQMKAFYEVTNYPTIKEDLGWRIELTGTIDAEGKTIAVTSVKRLEEVGPQCGLKKKTATK